MESRKYYVYIMSSVSGVLYIGVTNDLERRVIQHKDGAIDGFTKKYRCRNLVYYEEFQYVDKALDREKQLKRWSRKKKIAHIESVNPCWEDFGASLNGK